MNSLFRALCKTKAVKQISIKCGKRMVGVLIRSFKGETSDIKKRQKKKRKVYMMTLSLSCLVTLKQKRRERVR